MQADSLAARRDLEGTQQPRRSAPGGLPVATRGRRRGWRGAAGRRGEEARGEREEAGPVRRRRPCVREARGRVVGGGRARVGSGPGPVACDCASPGRGRVCRVGCARGGVRLCAHAARAGRVPSPLTKPQWSSRGGHPALSHARSAEPRAARTAEPGPAPPRPRGPRGLGGLGAGGTGLPLGKFCPRPSHLSGSVSKPLD